MYCKNADRANPCLGSEPRGRSWRTYSKNLILELKEKLAARRARTLTLLSENSDLTAFKEIDTESDGLDDTSTNMTNAQDTPIKEDILLPDHCPELVSLSESNSVTEYDYNDVEARGAESRHSTETSSCVDPRHCSESCSTATSASGESCTSEDVSSRSIEDYVLYPDSDNNFKREECTCPHILSVRCALCMKDTKMSEKHATGDSMYKQRFESSSHHHDFSSISSRPYFNRDNVTDISTLAMSLEGSSLTIRAKSEMLLHLLPDTAAASLPPHCSTAGLLMIPTCTEIQTHVASLKGEGSSRNAAQSVHHEVKANLSGTQEGSKETGALNLEEVYDNSMKLTHDCNNDDRGNVEAFECLHVEKYVSEKETVEDNEVEEEEEDAVEIATEEQINLTPSEPKEPKEEQKKMTGVRIKETDVNIHETITDVLEQISLNVGHVELSEWPHEKNQQKLELHKTAGSSRSISETWKVVSRTEQGQLQKLSSTTSQEGGQDTVSLQKDMLEELADIFQNNSEFYNTINKTLTGKFESHVTDFKMLISVYENMSGNSGYNQTPKKTSEAEDPVTRCTSLVPLESLVKLEDKTLSLRTCLEKARFASTLQSAVSSVTKTADRLAAARAYEQSLSELEQMLWDYLENNAREEAPDPAQSLERSGSSEESASQDKHKLLLHRSETFVVEEACRATPPSLAEGKSFSSSGTKVKLSREEDVSGEVEHQMCLNISKESLKLPHTSATFLLTDNPLSISANLLKQPNSNNGLQNENPTQDVDRSAGEPCIKLKSIAGRSHLANDHDFGSDSSESLSETKDVDNMYTSSMLAELLDYNSPDEYLKDRAENTKRQDNDKLKQTETLNTDQQRVKHHGVCDRKDTGDVEGDRFYTTTKAVSPPVKRPFFDLNDDDDDDDREEKYDYDTDFNTDSDNEDGEQDEKATNSHVGPVQDHNAENLTEDVRTHGMNLEPEVGSVELQDVPAEPSAYGKEKMEKGRRLTNEERKSNSSATAFVTSDTFEQLGSSGLQDGAVASKRDTSPSEKPKPTRIIGARTCSTADTRLPLTSGHTGGQSRHYFLGLGGQQLHRKLRLPREARQEVDQGVCQKMFVPNIDWSSSDEDMVDDLQRDISPSDLLRQKQKKDVNEKLQQLDQFSRRRRKSKSPLRVKTSMEFPFWTEDTKGVYVNPRFTESGKIFVNTKDVINPETNSWSNTQNTRDKLHQYRRLSGEINMNRQDDEAMDAVPMSASQLLLARIQEESHTDNKDECNQIIHHKTEETLNEVTAENKLESSPVNEGDDLICSLRFHNLCEDERLVTSPQQKRSASTASSSSTSDEYVIDESHDTVIRKSEGNLSDSRCEVGGQVSGGGERSQVQELESFSHTQRDMGPPMTTHAHQSSNQYSLNLSPRAVTAPPGTSDGPHPGNRFMNRENVSNVQSLEMNIRTDVRHEFRQVNTAEDLTREVSEEEQKLTVSPYPSCYISINDSYLPTDNTQNTKTIGQEQSQSSSAKADDADSIANKVMTFKNSQTKYQEFFNQYQQKAFSRISCTHPQQADATRQEDKTSDSHGFNPYLAQTDQDNSQQTPEYNSHQEFISEPSKKQYEIGASEDDQIWLFSEETNETLRDSVEKKDARKYIHEIRSPSLCTSLSFKHPHEQMFSSDKSPRNIQQDSSFSLSGGVQAQSLNNVVNSETHGPLHHIDVEGEYQALDALRDKVDSLEKMLMGNNTRSNGHPRESPTSLSKETQVYSATPHTCPLIQSCLVEHDLLQAQLYSLRPGRCLQPSCLPQINESDYLEPPRNWKMSSICPCEHRSYCNFHYGGHCTDSTSQQKDVSSKECRTLPDCSDENVTLARQAGAEWGANSNRFHDVFGDFCKSLEDRMTNMHQDVEDVKRYEELTNRMMTELDNKVNKLQECTALTLASHTEYLKRSQVSMSEGLREVQAAILTQNKLSESLTQHMAMTQHNFDTLRQLMQSLHLESVSRSIQTVEESIFPLKESLSLQNKETNDIKSGIEKIVSCLEERRRDSSPKGMGSNTMKERIVELTSQRDAEKVFHKITRQSLRALERDHERLRQEYIRATCRRYHHSDSEVQKRMWYHFHNQDTSHHHNNNYNNVIETSRTPESWSPKSTAAQEDVTRRCRHAPCDRYCPHFPAHRPDPECQRSITGCYIAAEFRNGSHVHTLGHGNITSEKIRDVSKSQSKNRTIQLSESRESREHISASDFSQRTTPADNSLAM